MECSWCIMEEIEPHRWSSLNEADYGIVLTIFTRDWKIRHRDHVRQHTSYHRPMVEGRVRHVSVLASFLRHEGFAEFGSTKCCRRTASLWERSCQLAKRYPLLSCRWLRFSTSSHRQDTKAGFCKSLKWSRRRGAYMG